MKDDGCLTLAKVQAAIDAFLDLDVCEICGQQREHAAQVGYDDRGRPLFRWVGCVGHTSVSA